ncbi:hypothetical protein BH09MYX1_BH09MYX1_20690 [soil metagenome]
MRSIRFVLPAIGLVSALSALSALSACKSESPPEPARRDPSSVDAAASDKPTGTALGFDVAGGRRPPPPAPHTVTPSPDDPKHGIWTLSDATAGLPAEAGADLLATITTTDGTLVCKLYADKAPTTVANFAGLARGLRPFKDSTTGTWVTRPAYDGTTFHRIIKGFMIQGCDPTGTGGGEQGYVIADELWGGKHDRAGLMCMANRGADTNGAQFFITDDAAAHLDKGYTIFGECKPEAVVHAIAQVPTGPGDRPLKTVTMKTVKITRGVF